MREIVLDTETTGLNPFDGHRIVEIGAVEFGIRCRPGERITNTSTRNARCPKRHSTSTVSGTRF
jgi:DNA polymerase III epsilon subunit-like protein